MITINGGSDDWVVLRAPNGDQQVNCWRADVAIVLGELTAGVRITMRYGTMPGGVWSAEIGQIDEGVPIPWPIAIVHECVRGKPGYSVVVSVDCPDTTRVEAKTTPHTRTI